LLHWVQELQQLLGLASQPDSQRRDPTDNGEGEREEGGSVRKEKGDRKSQAGRRQRMMKEV
jgi:hypothetical protein